MNSEPLRSAAAQLVKARAHLVRAHRFVKLAAVNLRFEARQQRRRDALRNSTVWRVGRSLRRAWMISDPAWAERIQADILAGAPERAAEQAEADRQRALARQRLAATGPAVYVGELRARVAHRGITLTDHDARPDVRSWLCEALGLDCYHGDRVRARLTVELLDDT